MPFVDETDDLILSEGLDGHDCNLDTLTDLWEELQLASVETAHPELDLITFATTCFYFAVISKRDTPPPPEKESPTDRELEVLTSFQDSLVFGKSQEGYTSSHTQWDTSGTTSRDFLPNQESLQGKEWNDIWDTDEEDTCEESGQPIVRWDMSSGTFNPSTRPTPSWNQPYGGLGQPPNVASTSYMYLPDAKPALGIVYLTMSPLVNAPNQVGELNIGIILDKGVRGRGYARQAVECVLERAFAKTGCHRVQATVLDNPSKDRALTLFTQLKFGHEGTRRRAFFSPLEQEWKDVTCLAILNTDWVIRPYFKAAPRSLWDEMFQRHAREREELLRWEDKRSRLQRTVSMETVREAPPSSVPSTPEPSQQKGKGKRELSHSYRDAYDASASEESDFDEIPYKLRKLEDSIRPPSSPTFSDRSLESVPRTESPDISDLSDSSSIGSQWDLLETSSAGSPSDSHYRKEWVH